MRHCASRWIVMAVAVLQGSGPLGAAPLQVGTTFSHKQCVYLGLEWKSAYHAVLQERFDALRLGAYWDELEPSDGVYDFTTLDWQIAQAKARGMPVILTVGMKAPRWPEYFIPPWLLRQLRLRKGTDVSRNRLLGERALRFIETVVRRYRDEPGIRCWQVENEPLDRSGPGYWWIGRRFLQQEIALVRRLDGRRPVLLTVATYPNRFLRFLAGFLFEHDPIEDTLVSCDILGVNVYPVVGHQWRWKASYYWSDPTERTRYLEAIMRRAAALHKPVWVTELQAEPWEPGQLVYQGRERPPTDQPELLSGRMEELQALGVETVLLWGAEYWQFRKSRHHDATWWRTVHRLLPSASP